jgi:hypothetical protein
MAKTTCPYLKAGRICVHNNHNLCSRNKKPLSKCWYMKNHSKCPIFQSIQINEEILTKDEKIAQNGFNSIWNRIKRMG